MKITSTLQVFWLLAGIAVAGQNLNAAEAPANTTAAVVPAVEGVQKTVFGQLPDGREVELFTLTNRRGAEAKIMTYGATIVEVSVPDRNGKMANVVLSTDSPAAYGRFPLAASVMGRVANRTAGAKFTLDGKDYVLAANDGPNHLHGGKIGFSKVIWTGETSSANTSGEPSVKFTYVSKDGDEGYPGTLTASVTYTLTENNTLRLEYAATTDKPTPVNLTNHAFFNLAGGTGDSNGYELMINAANYTVADAALIPTGEIQSVKGTPLDFTQPTALGVRAEQLGKARHYDNSFVLNRDKDAGMDAMELAARVTEPTTGRVMEVWTTEPGLQLYTSQLGGGPGRRAGFVVLETQHYPDAMHHANFPSIVLRPGETFKSETEYRFTAK